MSRKNRSDGVQQRFAVECYLFILAVDVSITEDFLVKYLLMLSFDIFCALLDVVKIPQDLLHGGGRHISAKEVLSCLRPERYTTVA